MQMEYVSMSVSCIVHLKITHAVETTMLCLTHTEDGKITDTNTAQNHFDCHTQTVISETFEQLGKVVGFNNVFHTHYSSKNNQQPSQNAGLTAFEGSSLASFMVKQIILQASLTSIEMFNDTKSNLKALTEVIKNPVQISGQNAICIAFSKLTGPLLLAANRLKTRSPTYHGLILKRNCQCNILLFCWTCM